MDPARDATALVEDRFPHARSAFLGGSVLTPRRTATSDLDIVVVLPGPPAPYRESLIWRDWPVELFTHTLASLSRWAGYDVARRRPTMPRLCVEGVVLIDRDGHAGAVREEMRRLLAAGPPPLTRAELDRRRYGLTDLLEDLAGGTDPREEAAIRWNVLVDTAELALLSERRWLGGGKWLVRELRDLDAGLADRLIGARDDPAALTAIADEVLAAVGGRLWAGYRSDGVLPGDHPPQ